MSISVVRQSAEVLMEWCCVPPQKVSNTAQLPSHWQLTPAGQWPSICVQAWQLSSKGLTLSTAVCIYSNNWWMVYLLFAVCIACIHFCGSKLETNGMFINDVSVEDCNLKHSSTCIMYTGTHIWFVYFHCLLFCASPHLKTNIMSVWQL